MNFRKLISGSAIAFASTVGVAAAQSPVLVTSDADSGEGSLRAALAAAAASETPSQIIVLADGDIEIGSTLDYTGLAPLTIIGNGQAIYTNEDVTLLAASNGANLTVHSLDFYGPGGWSITNRADTDGSAGKGIFVDVRDDQTGTVSLVLNDVVVAGVANHGIHVSDCSLADECGGGGGGAGEGSAASIVVHLTEVLVDDAGNGKFDADGVRVDERAEGSITLIADATTYINVGADGVELDEGQAGDVVAQITNSEFNDNGAYCDPNLLASFMPEVDEAEYDQGQTAEADIPGPITGSPDDGCFEREVDLYDDGSVEAYEFGIDLDDGFDIDEAGEGSIHLVMLDSEVVGNLDEGLDFDEEDAGGISVTISGTSAIGNTDDGYKMSEEGDGGIDGVMIGSAAIGNGGVGAVFEEEDGGDVAVTIIEMVSYGNDDGETSLELVQEDEGTGSATITNGAIVEPVEAEGVDVSQI